MLLWKTAPTSGGTYTQQLTPSTYDIEWEDLDADSYRAKTSGNLIRNIVSTKWFKGAFFYNRLTESQVANLLQVINNYPLYVNIKSPLFGSSGMLTCQCYVSKVKAVLINEGSLKTWNLSFNIVQSKKVSGQ